MAVAHYQFKAVHPFTDGNGRTGRVLNQLMLVEQKLLELPVPYLSRCIIRNKADYYRLLLAVTRDAAWEEWILYMLGDLRRRPKRGLPHAAFFTTPSALPTPLLAKEGKAVNYFISPARTIARGGTGCGVQVGEVQKK